jgi:U2 small nuclear ribonucleoprotein A'
MKLTQAVIIEAPSFISPTEARTLSLRNLNLTSLDAIHVIENTDIYSIIDLSKNNLSYITEFPKLLRLETLLLGNNHIRSISGLQNLINLQVLSITYNEILYLSDLENLKKLKSLRALYLTGNPVIKNKSYRLWCIWRFPTLQVLDFERVKQIERKQAKEMFDNNEELVNSILAIGVFSNNSTTLKIEQSTEFTEDERKRLEQQLEDADSFEEIQRLEKLLTKGHF